MGMAFPRLGSKRARSSTRGEEGTVVGTTLEQGMQATGLPSWPSFQSYVQQVKNNGKHQFSQGVCHEPGEKERFHFFWSVVSAGMGGHGKS